MKLESEPVAMIEMLVELEQQVIDIGDKPSGSSFYSLKQGIVD